MDGMRIAKEVNDGDGEGESAKGGEAEEPKTLEMGCATHLVAALGTGLEGMVSLLSFFQLFFLSSFFLSFFLAFYTLLSFTCSSLLGGRGERGEEEGVGEGFGIERKDVIANPVF